MAENEDQPATNSSDQPVAPHAHQPRPGRTRQLRRRLTTATTSGAAPEGTGQSGEPAAQRQPAKSRQMRTVKQLKAPSEARSAVVKVQFARTAQARQHAATKSAALPADPTVANLPIFKVAQARAAQPNQKATRAPGRPQ